VRMTLIHIMVSYSNAVRQDLSLLTHLTAAEISELQSAQDSRKEFVLRDDADKVWTHLQTVKDGRVDWILDNAGYEVGINSE
jgi:hypothetical protein